jgi:hypothetical protein
MNGRKHRKNTQKSASEIELYIANALQVLVASPPTFTALPKSEHPSEVRMARWAFVLATGFFTCGMVAPHETPKAVIPASMEAVRPAEKLLPPQICMQRFGTTFTYAMAGDAEASCVSNRPDNTVQGCLVQDILFVAKATTTSGLRIECKLLPTDAARRTAWSKVVAEFVRRENLKPLNEHNVFLLNTFQKADVPVAGAHVVASKVEAPFSYQIRAVHP